MLTPGNILLIERASLEKAILAEIHTIPWGW